MKKILYLIFCLLSLASYSQNKILKLKKINSERVKIIEEYKRVKVQTIVGKKYVGKFTIVNDSTVLIDNEAILLNSIVRVRQKSLFCAITNPILITHGSLAVIAGIAAAAGGFGYLITIVALPIGIPMILIPAISNNHLNKDWEYSIETK